MRLNQYMVFLYLIALFNKLSTLDERNMAFKT